MGTEFESTYFNKSAYIALSCLIAFVIVITICAIKQFIWDPLLSKRFEIIRPVLSESVRKFSSSFYRPQSTKSSSISIHKSISDACVTTSDPPLLSSKNLITVTQSLPSTDNQYNPINKKIPHRSYGSSSFNSYTNFGSEDLNEVILQSPILHFSCEYNPSTSSIRLNVQNLHHMNLFHSTLDLNDTYIFIRFLLSATITDEPYETTLQQYQDFIRFGETFTILSNIQPGDVLNYEIKFSIILIVDEQIFELGEAIYSMKDDYLTSILYVEKTLPINLKLIKSETNK